MSRFGLFLKPGLTDPVVRLRETRAPFLDRCFINTHSNHRIGEVSERLGNVALEIQVSLEALIGHVVTMRRLVDHCDYSL